MITVNAFLDAVKANARRIHGYKLGHDGSDGYSDCVGLIIGALRLAGIRYTGTHGSNYFARYYTYNLRKVSRAADLHAGDVVFKAHAPGEAGYDAAVINSKYKKSGDLNDYYHVGIVTSVQPLTIAHCSTGGMHYDTKMGKWAYAAYCRNVGMDMQENEFDIGDQCVVDTPNNGSLNVRADPRINARIITKIKEGQQVTITAVSGDWVEVKYAVGYVQKKFLRGES